MPAFLRMISAKRWGNNSIITFLSVLRGDSCWTLPRIGLQGILIMIRDEISDDLFLPAGPEEMAADIQGRGA